MAKRLCSFFLSIFLVAALMLCVPAEEQTQKVPEFTPEEQEYISAHKSLKVGFVPDRIPVSFSDNGEFSGISRYILDRISGICGIKFEYKQLPTKDVTYDYLTGEGLDLVTSVEFNEENKHARGILISSPYLSSRKVVVAHDGFEFRSDGEFTVAVATGSQTLKTVLSKSFPNFKIQDYDSISECLDAVNSRQADLMIQNQYVVEYWLSKPKYENLKVIPVVGLDDELCFSAVVQFGENSEQSQKDGGILIDILDKSIACLSEDEVLNYVIEGVMENQYSYNFEDFFSRYKYTTFIMCIASVAIIVLAVILIRQRIRIAENHANAKARGEFLSTMSHEIRTPLNGMVGLNRLMSQNLDNKNKLEEYLSQSTVTAKYLLTLVNDLLDSSKLQANVFKLDKKTVDLSLLADSVITTAKSSMRDRNIDFQTSLDIKEPYIVGDSVRIQQILFNLLDNAGKFTRSGGTVKFTLKQEKSGNDIVNIFTVSDNGRGMSEEFISHVFDAFAQELDTVSKGNQGTGLGLSISRRLARLLDGDLTCESEKGKGSTFTFKFSAEPAAAPETVQNVAVNVNQRVLVADDNELNAEIISDLLDSVGYKTDIAQNGKEAVELFEKSEVNTYGIIIMDLLMPELDGYEATKAIRAFNRSDAKTVKIIACTANSFNEEHERALDAGMNDFVTKPVDLDDLLEKMDK